MGANCYEWLKLKKKSNAKRELAKSIEKNGSCDYSVWNY